MAQGFPTFMIFNTGLQVLFIACIFWACDVKRWRLWVLHDVFDAFGKNTLMAYLLHLAAVQRMRECLACISMALVVITMMTGMPDDTPAYVVFLSFMGVFFSLYLGMVCTGFSADECIQ